MKMELFSRMPTTTSTPPTRFSFFWLFFAGLMVEKGGGKAVFGNEFPRFQKNYWYEYSSPPSTSYPEYVDYHLNHPETMTVAPNQPHILGSSLSGSDSEMENVTTQLGSSATLHCRVRNLQDKTVSWLKRPPSPDGDPVLLSFGTTVYISDVRITVERRSFEDTAAAAAAAASSPTSGTQTAGSAGDNSRHDDWVLSLLNAQPSDEATYECQVSTEPPLKHRVHLFVEAPSLTVMDGFGRELVDQYYKVGSSLEVMCHVDKLPARPLPDIIEWRHGNRKLAHKNTTLGQSIRTELDGPGAISHLAITQASVRHSGIYTCSVSDTISQSLRLHIIDESKPVPIINNSGSRLTSFFFLVCGGHGRGGLILDLRGCCRCGLILGLGGAAWRLILLMMCVIFPPYLLAASVGVSAGGGGGGGGQFQPHRHRCSPHTSPAPAEASSTEGPRLLRRKAKRQRKAGADAARVAKSPDCCQRHKETEKKSLASIALRR